MKSKLLVINIFYNNKDSDSYDLGPEKGELILINYMDAKKRLISLDRIPTQSPRR